MTDTLVTRLPVEGCQLFPPDVAVGSQLPPAPPAAPDRGDDRTLIEKLGRALSATGYSTLRGIEIEIHHGVVVLWGRVPNYHQKQLAQATVQQVPGVRRVANGIDVVCSR